MFKKILTLNLILLIIIALYGCGVTAKNTDTGNYEDFKNYYGDMEVEQSLNLFEIGNCTTASINNTAETNKITQTTAIINTSNITYLKYKLSSSNKKYISEITYSYEYYSYSNGGFKNFEGVISSWNNDDIVIQFSNKLPADTNQLFVDIYVNYDNYQNYNYGRNSTTIIIN